MKRRGPRARVVPHLAGLALLASATAFAAQVAENRSDPFGIAIPYPVVHLVHSENPEDVGTTGYLRAHDPYLLFVLGRDLVNRQYERRHGTVGRAGELSVPLYVPVSRGVSLMHGRHARFARDHAASCGLCHSSVYREPSAGQTIASTGGLGRNTTHFYGAGLVEMIGEQVTQTILNEFDRDGNGVIDRMEAEQPRPIRVEAVTGTTIDYGDVSPGADGVPRLNSVFRLWYVDAEGLVLPDATSLNDPHVAGFGLAMQPFGWGRGRVRLGDRLIAQGGESSTLREFFAAAADVHMGLQAHDPTQQRHPGSAGGFGGAARTSLNGARQYDFGAAVDLGRSVTAGGVSLDDPDGDGHRSELTEGDLDAVEFYMLHLPAPAVRVTPRGEQGRALLHQVGCTACHTENWQINARDAYRGFPGDRRLFRLEVGATTTSPALTGRLVSSAQAEQGFLIERIYSDFKHWDVGPAFHERRFDGSLQMEHRTAPLWGVGSTAPYGNAGNFRDLRSVILAHGGAASESRQAFSALPESDRERVLEYLNALVLYQSSEVPSDIDGDGKVSQDFRVAGRNVGYERFNPEFLLRTPPRYKRVGSFVHPNGRTLPTMLIINIEDAYGLTHPHRIDRDRDSFPDVLGPIRAQQ